MNARVRNMVVAGLAVIAVIAMLVLWQPARRRPVVDNAKKTSAAAVSVRLAATHNQCRVEPPPQPITNEDIRCVLRGTARTEDGGRVFSFLVSLAAGSQERFRRTVVTDDHCVYLLADVPTGVYTLTAEIPGSRLTTNVVLAAGTNTCDMVFPGAWQVVVTGVVLYAYSGAPVAHARVVYQPADTWLAQQDTSTDRHGLFSLRITVAGSQPCGSLHVHEPGYAPARYDLGERYAGAFITIYVLDTGVLEGLVLTPDHQPISGAVVYATQRGFGAQDNRASFISDYPWHTPAQTFAFRSEPTGAEGFYRIPAIAAPCTFELQAVADGFVTPSVYVAERPRVTTEVSKTIQRNLILCREPELLLKVRDSNGQPVLRYDLAVLYLNATDFLEEACQRATSVVLPDDVWYRVPVSNAYLGQTVPARLRVTCADGRAGATNLLLHLGTQPVYVIMTVSAEQVQIDGLLCAADDTPLPNHMVRARAGEAARRSATHAVTDTSGRFLIAGLSAVHGAPVWLTHWQSGSSTCVPCGARGLVFRIAQPPAPTQTNAGFIAGRVALHTPHTPATNFALQLDEQDWAHYFNPRGAFSLSVSAGSRGVIMVRAPGYTEESVPYDLSAQPVCDVGTIVLTRRCGTVRGTVRLSTGQPVSVSVAVTSGDQTRYVTSSSEDGSYRCDDVPPGMVHAEVELLDGMRAHAGPVNLPPGGEVVLPDLVLAATNVVHVTVELLLPGGQPAADAFVASGIYRPTDADGCLAVFLTPHVPHVWYVHHGGRSYETTPFMVQPGTERTAVNLLTCTLVRGQILYRGQPLLLGWMLLQRADGLRVNAALYDGMFAVYIRPGMYTATVYIRGENVRRSTSAYLHAGDGNVIMLD